MKSRLLVSTAIGFLAAAAIAAIDRGGITRGAIESVQPFVVAGTPFDVSQAVVDIAGSPGSVSDLRTGQIITVRSEFDGVAIAGELTLSFRSVGAIEAIDRGGIALLGQTVRINSDTMIGGAVEALTRNANSTGRYRDPLVPGQRVAITGYLLPDNSTLATRIDLAQLTEDTVSGHATNVEDNRLSIEGLVVDFSKASLSGFDDEPQDADRVVATGVLKLPGLLVASTLTRMEALPTVEPGDEVDLDGFITRFGSIVDFDVDGVPFTINGETEFDNGTVFDLRPGAFVRVDGVVTASGHPVLAEEIEFAADD